MSSCIDKKTMNTFAFSIASPTIFCAFFPQSLVSIQVGVVVGVYFLGMLWVSRRPRSEYDRFIQTNCNLKRIADEEYQKSTVDWLTKVNTRSFLEAALSNEAVKFLLGGKPFSLLMIDVDNFKLVNDNFGHAFGDVTLQVTAERIANSVKSDDTVARYGGEEFCVLLPSLDREEAYAVAERLRTDIEQNKISKNELQANVTISIGGVSINKNHTLQNSEQVLELADKALYKAKRNGRNQTQWAEG